MASELLRLKGAYFSVMEDLLEEFHWSKADKRLCGEINNGYEFGVYGWNGGRIDVIPADSPKYITRFQMRNFSSQRRQLSLFAFAE
jgi:hypothetical protein